jgi:hypothetical protein
MYRMSQITASTKNNTNFFAVPFNNFEPNTGGELCQLTKEDMVILNHHRICTSALLLILSRGYDYYNDKKKLAVQYGSAKKHGNIGRE